MPDLQAKIAEAREAFVMEVSHFCMMSSARTADKDHDLMAALDTLTNLIALERERAAVERVKCTGLHPPDAQCGLWSRCRELSRIDAEIREACG